MNEKFQESELHPLDIALSLVINGHPDISEKILKEQSQDDLRVLFNLGWHEMRHGNLHKGFEYLNYGRFLNVFGLPPVSGKLWKDESLDGKTLLFRCEGGYGDQILNFRFVKYFKNMGARVVISCAPELKQIFSRHGYVCVDNESVSGIYYDYWIPAMSAAFLLGLEYETLNGEPYIYPKYKRKLFSKDGTLKVGVRWAGNPKFEHEQHRRFPSNLLVDLHTTPNTTFFSLQRDNDLISGIPFGDMSEQMKTWDDTATIIAGCDLIISSCTSIAHLAGSMGIPTWIVLPIMPYYTWAMPGNTSKWYDSVRLYRQTKYGNWEEPFNEVKQDLLKLVKGR